MERKTIVHDSSFIHFSSIYPFIQPSFIHFFRQNSPVAGSSSWISMDISRPARQPASPSAPWGQAPWCQQPIGKKAPTGDFFGILNVTKCQSFSDFYDFYSTFMTFKKMFHNLFQRSAGHEREPNFPPASVFRPLQLNRSKNWKGTVRQPFCQSTYSLQGVFYCFRIQAAATQTFKLWTFQDNVWHAVRMPLTVKTCSSIVWRIFSHKRGSFAPLRLQGALIRQIWKWCMPYF